MGLYDKALHELLQGESRDRSGGSDVAVGTNNGSKGANKKNKEIEMMTELHYRTFAQYNFVRSMSSPRDGIIVEPTDEGFDYGLSPYLAFAAHPRRSPLPEVGPIPKERVKNKVTILNFIMYFFLLFKLLPKR